MSEICKCGGAAGNLGQPNCVPIAKRDAKLILVSYYDNNGEINAIKQTDTVDDTYVTNRINAGNIGSSLDVSKRWYFTDQINSVGGGRAENVTQDIDGIPYPVIQGVRDYKGKFYGSTATPKLVGALNSRSCNDDGYFIIDVEGNIVGIEGVDNTGAKILKPIKIQKLTLIAIYNKPTASEIANVELSFLVDQNEKDSDLGVIYSSDLTVDLLSYKSLIDVTSKVNGTPTTTGFVIDVSLPYAGVFTNLPMKGLVLADFVVFNQTQSTAITPTSVTESSDGVYTFVMPAQTASDVISVNLQKTGFEMAELTLTV